MAARKHLHVDLTAVLELASGRRLRKSHQALGVCAEAARRRI
jgi:hypothetical protein